MREIILKRLKGMLNVSDGCGIPRYAECDESEFITDSVELENMSDEALLEIYDASIGFHG